MGGFRSRTSYTIGLINNINSGVRTIYCHGWFNYIDIFINPHEIEFCRRYIVKEGRFAPAGGKERNHAN